MKTPVLRKSKYYILKYFPTSQQLGLHSHIDGSVGRKQIPSSFSDFKSKKFLHESSYDVVSGTDNDEKSLKKP